MRRKNIYLLLFLVSVIAAFFLYMYVFNIYEVEVSVNPRELFADGKSTLKIEAVPLNSFGKRAPFRNVSAEFNFTEGSDLVSVITRDEKNGVIVLKAKFTPGKVEVMVKPEKSLLPSLVEIQINPNYADANKF